MKRVFLIVLDSVGIGASEDAADFGDAGTNTLRSAATSPCFHMPNMKKLGLFNIDGVRDWAEPDPDPVGVYGRMTERSKRKGYHDRPLGDCRCYFRKALTCLSSWLSRKRASGI